MLVFAVTKFEEGAWIVLVLTPTLVTIFFAIHRHYRALAQQLSLERERKPWHSTRHCVTLPVGGVHRGTQAALNYARTLSDDITAAHVSLDPAEAERVHQRWQQWGDGICLVILDSPYRELVEPLLHYIGEVAAHRQPNELITVVVPQFVPRSWWHNFLHNQTAVWLRLALLFKPGIVVTDVPFHVE